MADSLCEEYERETGDKVGGFAEGYVEWLEAKAADLRNHLTAALVARDAAQAEASRLRAEVAELERRRRTFRLAREGMAEHRPACPKCGCVDFTLATLTTGEGVKCWDCKWEGMASEAKGRPA